MLTELGVQGRGSDSSHFRWSIAITVYAFISYYSGTFKIVNINLLLLNVLFQIKLITCEKLRHSSSILCSVQCCSENYCDT